MRHTPFSVVRSIACALLLAALHAACAVTPAAPHVYVVRHAEKMSGDDPALSEMGIARAEALANLLAERNITRIFSTDTHRTRGTAAPLAARLGIQTEIYDHRAPEQLAARIRESGETVLVVGHSNTIAGIAATFGVDAGSAVEEDEYDRLYVIRLAPSEVHGEIRWYPEAKR